MTKVLNLRTQPEEPQLLELLNFISDCVWKAEASHQEILKYRYVSPGIQVITGLSSDIFMSGHHVWLSLVHPDDYAYVESGYRRVMIGDSLSDRNEYRIKTRLGLKLVRENILVGCDRKSGKRLLYGVISDITENRDYQEEKVRLAAIVENSDDCILSKSLDGVIQTWNRGAERMYGYSAEEIIGQSVAQLIPEERQGELGIILTRIKRGERIEHYETIRKRKDGTFFPVSFSVSPLLNASGKIVGASTIARDITAQKTLEQQLEIKNSALRKSNLDLEQFAAVASHDLQEPLLTTRLYCDLLRKELGPRLDEKSREYLNFVLNATRGMSDLIQDVLEYSRLGRFPSMTHVNASTLAHRAKENLAQEIIKKQARVEIKTLPTVIANGPELTRVFQELMANALKYSKREYPSITISADSTRSDWVFSVSDDGIGIDPKERENIFVIFHRLHTLSEYPGTGIGLASCRKIIEAHQGHIWVDGNEYGGSTFRFTIPRENREPQEKSTL